MPRPLLLSTAAWADLPLEELAPQAVEWGCQGLDLCCWGDHFEVQRALGETDYCTHKVNLLSGLELTMPVISVHRVSQAVSDPVDGRHREWLPDYVWGDGKPEGVQQRAAEEIIAAARAAEQVGASVLCGHTGSPLWPLVSSATPFTSAQVDEGLDTFVRQWGPILDACQQAGLRYAAVVRPGQIAFDYFSAERVLDALADQPEFGFALDPSQLHWQGVDPVEFIRRFGDRLYHVLLNDAVVTLNGRSGLFGSYVSVGDSRRGWQGRCLGRGGVDWEAVIRALNEVGYEGPLAVDRQDAGMNREAGAQEACRFARRLDFEPPPRPESQAFR